MTSKENTGSLPPSSSSTNAAPPNRPAAQKPPGGQEFTRQDRWQRGLFWALMSPVFLGIVPILAKLSYAAGANVMTVVIFRTVFAAIILWLSILLFARHYVHSSLPAIAGSAIAGAVNGFGSIFFYASLTRIDASLGQLINITYLVFVTVLLRLAGQTISLLTIFRTALTIMAVFLLTQGGLGPPDWIGVGMMLVAALMYAIQLVLSQRIMLDIPAPTMTLYAISSMAVTVTAASLIFPINVTAVSTAGWRAILFMGLATALARLTLFLGVKNLGSIQTALLGVMEVIVTISIAAIWLGERLTWIQWAGAIILMTSIFLVRFERGVPKFIDWWQFILRWLLRR